MISVAVLGCPSAPATRPVEPTPVATPQPDNAESPVAEEPAAEKPPAPERNTPIADRYRDTAEKIIAAALASRDAYTKLAYLTDRIGHRLSGSKALERAIAWAAKTMGDDGHENVHTEKVMVPHWVRGRESAAMLAPMKRELHILGLGNTIGTGRRGVTGEVVVLDDFEQFKSIGDRVKGKIVLYNKAMPKYEPSKGTGYGEVAGYRVAGPSIAARHGAVAVLMRSLTAHSLHTPHTGTLVYDPKAPKIPAAAVTTEDADWMARLVAGGQKVEVQLKLGAKMLPDKESANVIAEIKGRERPHEIVVIGAHIDSWDVGQGAHDDGAGCAIVMQALTTLRELGLRPRRTIRVVLFTNEENGIRGARAYGRDHKDELDDHVMAMEADIGGFAPRMFSVTGTDLALEQTRDIITLLESVGVREAKKGHSGTDIHPIAEAGASTLGLVGDIRTYFDIHHTDADTLDKVDPTDLAQNVAAAAVMAYVIADMPDRFGGDKPAPATTK